MDQFLRRTRLSDIVREFDLKADKSLGQHFLLDPNLLAAIAARAAPLAGLNVIEIGPGPGGLTRALLDSDAAHVTAVEFDPRAVRAIEALAAEAEGRLTIIEADALRQDLTAFVPAPRAVVANLPYNVGTPLLVSWLAQAGAFSAFTLMFQLEVAERICAAPDTDAYGRLAVLSQWLCEAAIVMHIPAAAFAPPPKVDSALVRLIPRPNQPDRKTVPGNGASHRCGVRAEAQDAARFVEILRGRDPAARGGHRPATPRRNAQRRGIRAADGDTAAQRRRQLRKEEGYFL